jgi:hypothetical protein
MSTLNRILCAVVFFASTSAGFAGPCTDAIADMQSRLDARLAASTADAPSAPESTAATLHHQPTPDSIAAAEANLGAGVATQQAAAALSRARTADASGDKAGCQQALADAESSLSQ